MNTVSAGAFDYLTAQIDDLIGGTAGEVTISHLDFVVVGTSNNEVVFQSNVFTYRAEQPCTLLLTASNNDDAYGVRFGGALYNPQLRVKGTLRSATPNNERSSHIDSNLKKQITYFRQRKIKELRLSSIADYQVDWLTLWAGYNVVFVEDIEYVVEEDNDIEVRTNRFCDTAALRINIGKQLQDLESSNQRGLSAATNINNYLVETKDLTSKIVFLDNDEIEING